MDYQSVIEHARTCIVRIAKHVVSVMEKHVGIRCRDQAQKESEM